ncbi:MAG: hypothetical protein ABF979_14515 [Gluconobacter sp.]|uniref:MarR family transcriptional regulator n=1 Tax=Acetobacter aceti TaxID=435 RepID=A0A1U9KDK6_ACEAC|nr:hypothetical protein [Acetobacter aceti]AQS83881.1 hypothetical protein A0U92_02840 [Acetobacter aceti]
MSVSETIVGDRRRSVLESLSEMSSCMLNEDVLLRAVLESGRHTDHDTLRDDLVFLERRSCLRIEKLMKSDGDLWKVVLTPTGQRVARGEQIVSGVAQALAS